MIYFICATAKNILNILKYSILQLDNEKICIIPLTMKSLLPTVHCPSSRHSCTLLRVFKASALVPVYVQNFPLHLYLYCPWRKILHTPYPFFFPFCLFLGQDCVQCISLSGSLTALPGKGKDNIFFFFPCRRLFKVLVCIRMCSCDEDPFSSS